MRKYYQTKSDQELLIISSKQGLTDEAMIALDEEISSRGIDPSLVEQYKAHRQEIAENATHQRILVGHKVAGSQTTKMIIICSVSFLMGLFLLFTKDWVLGVALTLLSPVVYIVYLFLITKIKKVLSKILS